MTSSIHLDSAQLLDLLRKAKEAKEPLSVIRIGDGENIVLSQYAILPEHEFMKTSVGRNWPEHGSGVRLPDEKARDEIVCSLKKANAIGLLPHNDRQIKADRKYKRSLTDQIFETYGISPNYTFDALLFRDFLTDPGFWEVMSGQNIVVISRWARKFQERSQKAAEQWGFRIVDTIPIENYYGIPRVMERLQHMEFDTALLCAGVGSIVLCQQIAELKGSIAIDIGAGLRRIAKGRFKIPLPEN